ncbi:THUMP domain-containing protein, partial [Eggerthella sinensis]|uniref:THUMP domain-containing protein n=1 Tax=Eggerthella sinensis TaxID=242230 RepID=UPI0022E56804
MSNPCNENLELFASCLSGLEASLAEELKRLGIKRVRPLGGGVAFFCDVRHALSACLWSRLASRILVVVGRVNAGDANLLYEGVRRLPWEDVIAPGASMAVTAHGMNEELRNTRFAGRKHGRDGARHERGAAQHPLHRAQGEGRRVRPPARSAQERGERPTWTPPRRT